MERQTLDRRRYIPMREDLYEDPAVLEMARGMGVPALYVVGCLHRVWCWFQRNSDRNRTMNPNMLRVIDRITGIHNFSMWLRIVGWLHVTEKQITMPTSDHKPLTQQQKKILIKSVRESNRRRRVSLGNDHGHRRTAKNKLLVGAVEDELLLDSTTEETASPSHDKVSALSARVYGIEGELNLFDVPSGDTLAPPPRVDYADPPPPLVDSNLPIPKEVVYENPRTAWTPHLEAWNEIARKYARPTIESLSEVRKARLRSALKAHPNLWEEIDRAFSELGEWGQQQRFFTFDWITKQTNLTKMLEGNYSRNAEVQRRKDPEAHSKAVEAERIRIRREMNTLAQEEALVEDEGRADQPSQEDAHRDRGARQEMRGDPGVYPGEDVGRILKRVVENGGSDEAR